MFHVEEINPKCKLDDGKVTRKSVSSSFCGMLNRGSGADCRSLIITQKLSSISPNELISN